jgi:hypothetical protein
VWVVGQVLGGEVGGALAIAGCNGTRDLGALAELSDGVVGRLGE